jgi:hypothetical protein
MIPREDCRKDEYRKGLGRDAESLASHLPHDTRSFAPDLAAVVAAWPTLPEALRAGIVAMVRASGG